MKKLVIITISLLLLVFSACDQSDSTMPAPVDDMTGENESASEASTELGESQAVSSADWNVYLQAKALTDAINDREYQNMVYTKISDINGSSTQSVNMSLALTGINEEVQEMLAQGTVRAEDKLMDLEVYYKDGMLYSRSGDSRSSVETDFNSALLQTDVLYSFRNELVYEYIKNISCEYSVDGMKLIKLEFQGIINGILTEGNGEIIINSSGYIISESYDLTAISDGRQINQSVESTLVSFGEKMQPITAPDLSEYN